jgi:predicted RNA-binding protein with PUA-like domain
MPTWLIKSEPSVYPFSQLVADRKTVWDGVRNFEARNNLRKMKKGDLCLYYHSNADKAVVGVARVAKEAYADPTAEPREDWSAVELEAVVALTEPVTLATMRITPALSEMVVVKKSRLSITPVTESELASVLAMGKTSLEAHSGTASQGRAASRPRGSRR